MTSITLPRPSRKDNLANIVISNLYSIGPSVADIGERKTKEKEAEREYQGTDSGTYPTRLEGCARPAIWWS